MATFSWQEARYEYTLAHKILKVIKRLHRLHYTHNKCICHLQLKTAKHTNKAYIHALGGSQWTQVASMSGARKGPTCGVVRNWATDKEEVIAAGGYRW